MKSTNTFYAGIGLLLLCTTLYADRKNRTLGTIAGGLLGGTVGALSSDDPGKGAALGSFLGATAGAVLASDEEEVHVYHHQPYPPYDAYHELAEELRKVKRNNQKQAYRIGKFRKEVRALKQRVKELKKENKSLNKQIRRLS